MFSGWYLANLCWDCYIFFSYWHENHSLTHRYFLIYRLMDSLPRLQLHQIETIESCTHEVALPPEMTYEPLKPPTGPPAKEYPFILDPFQKEALLCLENEQSVRAVLRRYLILQSNYHCRLYLWFYRKRTSNSLLSLLMLSHPDKILCSYPLHWNRQT